MAWTTSSTRGGIRASAPAARDDGQRHLHARPLSRPRSVDVLDRFPTDRAGRVRARDVQGRLRPRPPTGRTEDGVLGRHRSSGNSAAEPHKRCRRFRHPQRDASRIASSSWSVMTSSATTARSIFASSSVSSRAGSAEPSVDGPSWCSSRRFETSFGVPTRLVGNEQSPVCEVGFGSAADPPTAATRGGFHPKRVARPSDGDQPMPSRS